jgi:membrane glycosyltransferase
MSEARQRIEGAVESRPRHAGPAGQTVKGEPRRYAGCESCDGLFRGQFTARRGNRRWLATPEIRRVSMTPSNLERSLLRRLWPNLSGKTTHTRKHSSAADPFGTRPSENVGKHVGWRHAANRRRIALALVALGQTALAGWSLARTFPAQELSALQIAIIVNFCFLFSWISFSFWSNIAGFWTLWWNRRVYCLAEEAKRCADQPLRSRTAVVMPICDEDVSRCFAAIQAVYSSLAQTGELEHFDFFVLSDTGDAERQVEEEIAWAKTCLEVKKFRQIYYRHRRNNVKRKSGNIADFLRRWALNYNYMVVLDADSLMSGEILVQLARLMDRHPQLGVVQTVPTIVNGQSLFTRAQQFASRCYGPLFSASLHFWQLGESYYWGHNAILRVAPFLKHCGLARLSGKPPLGGEILSHDFVEAALMGRAGWEVWLAPGSSGSYEESPPSLLDELKRDRRWCQGNLQHLRLWLGDGIKTGHRAILVMGVMSYASALLWLVFLLLNTIELVAESLIPPVYFSPQPRLFPIWPEWHPEWALALVGTTALLLLLPKLLSFLLILKRGEASLYGGWVCLGVSIALEIVLSTLLAPIRMWFHSKFVLLTLIGRQITWKTQSRTSNTTGWQEAISAHGSSALFASAWIASLSGINPAVLLWLAPVTTSLILSIPLSVYLSRPSLGQAAKRWRLFQIPEETFAPPVVAAAQSIFARRRVRDFPGGGFVYTVMDLPANRLHGEVLRWRTPKSPRDRERNKVLHESALNDGLAVLSSSQKAHLLNDADSMYALHGEIYQRGDPPVTVHRCVDSFDKLEGFIDSLRHKQGKDRSLPVFRRLQSSKHDLPSLQENANVKADECSKS